MRSEPAFKLVASGGNVPHRQAAIEFADFVLVPRADLEDVYAALGGPLPNAHTHDVPPNPAAILARLAATDGNRYDSCIVTWKAAQALVAHVRYLEQESDLAFLKSNRE